MKWLLSIKYSKNNYRLSLAINILNTLKGYIIETTRLFIKMAHWFFHFWVDMKCTPNYRMTHILFQIIIRGSGFLLLFTFICGLTVMAINWASARSVVSGATWVKVKVKVKVCLLLHVPNCFSTAKFLRLGKHHSSTQ